MRELACHRAPLAARTLVPHASTAASPAHARAVAYFDRLAGSYESHVHRGPLRWLRARERKTVIELASLQVGGGARTLLDVGCGAGSYTLHAQQCGFRVCAVDASPAMVAGLRAEVDEAHVGDVEQLPFDRTFDRVLCIGVLEFTRNPTRAVAELMRAVAPGGRLVILAPRLGPGGLFYWVEKRLAGISVHLFRERWLADTIEANGGRVLAIRRPLPSNFVLCASRPSNVREPNWPLPAAQLRQTSRTYGMNVSRRPFAPSIE